MNKIYWKEIDLTGKNQIVLAFGETKGSIDNVKFLPIRGSTTGIMVTITPYEFQELMHRAGVMEIPSMDFSLLSENPKYSKNL